MNFNLKSYIYRDEINSLQIQLSRTQAGPGRAVKEQQEQNSPNHVQRINLISVHSRLAGGKNKPLHIGMTDSLSSSCAQTGFSDTYNQCYA